MFVLQKTAQKISGNLKKSAVLFLRKSMSGPARGDISDVVQQNKSALGPSSSVPIHPVRTEAAVAANVHRAEVGRGEVTKVAGDSSGGPLTVQGKTYNAHGHSASEQGDTPGPSLATGLIIPPVFEREMVHQPNPEAQHSEATHARIMGRVLPPPTPVNTYEHDDIKERIDNTATPDQKTIPLPRRVIDSERSMSLRPKNSAFASLTARVPIFSLLAWNTMKDHFQSLGSELLPHQKQVDEAIRVSGDKGYVDPASIVTAGIRPIFAGGVPLLHHILSGTSASKTSLSSASVENAYLIQQDASTALTRWLGNTSNSVDPRIQAFIPSFRSALSDETKDRIKNEDIRKHVETVRNSTNLSAEKKTEFITAAEQYMKATRDIMVARNSDDTDVGKAHVSLPIGYPADGLPDFHEIPLSDLPFGLYNQFSGGKTLNQLDPRNGPSHFLHSAFWFAHSNMLNWIKNAKRALYTGSNQNFEEKPDTQERSGQYNFQQILASTRKMLSFPGAVIPAEFSSQGEYVPLQLIDQDENGQEIILNPDESIPHLPIVHSRSTAMHGLETNKAELTGETMKTPVSVSLSAVRQSQKAKRVRKTSASDLLKTGLRFIVDVMDPYPTTALKSSETAKQADASLINQKAMHGQFSTVVNFSDDFSQMAVAVVHEYFDRQTKSSTQTTLSRLRFAVPAEVTAGLANRDYTKKDTSGRLIDPSDDRYQQALQICATSINPKEIQEANHVIARWENNKENGGDPAKYLIIQRLGPAEKAHYFDFMLQYEKQYHIKNREGKVDPSTSTRFSIGELSRRVTRAIKALAFGASKDTIGKIEDEFANQTEITNNVPVPTKTGQEKYAESQANPVTKRQYLQSLYSFAWATSRDMLAETAAHEHERIALHLARSTMSPTQDLLIGSTSKPLAFGRIAEIPNGWSPTVLPDGVPHAYAGYFRATRLKDPVFLPNQNTPEILPPESPYGFDLMATMPNASQMNQSGLIVNTVDSTQRTRFGRKLDLHHSWRFAPFAVDDSTGFLNQFNINAADKNLPVIENANDLLTHIQQGIGNFDGAIIAAQQPENEERRDQGQPTPLQAFGNGGAIVTKINDDCTVQFDNPRKPKRIIIKGIKVGLFSDTTSVSGVPGKSLTGISDKNELSLEIKTKKDKQGRTIYYLDMSPLRKEAKILSHMGASQTQSLGVVDPRLEGTTKLQVQHVPSDTETANEVISGSSISGDTVSEKSLSRFEQRTGFSLTRNIRDFFTKQKLDSTSNIVVGVKGNIAIVMTTHESNENRENHHRSDTLPSSAGYDNAVLDTSKKNWFMKYLGGNFFGNDQEGFGNVDLPKKPMGVKKWFSDFWKNLKLRSTSSEGSLEHYEEKKRIEEIRKPAYARPVTFSVISLGNMDAKRKTEILGTSVGWKEGETNFRAPATNADATTLKYFDQANNDLKYLQRANSLYDELITEISKYGLQLGSFASTKANPFDALIETCDQAINSTSDSRIKTIINKIKTNVETHKSNCSESGNNIARTIGVSRSGLDLLDSEIISTAITTIDRQRASAKKDKSNKLSIIGKNSVLFSVPAEEDSTTYSGAVERIFDIVKTLENGELSQSLLSKESSLNQPQTVAEMFAKSAIDKIKDHRNGGLLNQGIGRDTQSQKSTPFPLYVLPSFASLNDNEVAGESSYSPLQLERKISGFSDEFKEFIKSLGASIVIHGGDRKSVEKINPELAKLLHMDLASRNITANPNAITWNADGTIFLGTKSKTNPLHDLVRQLTDIGMEKYGLLDDQTNGGQNKTYFDEIIDSYVPTLQRNNPSLSPVDKKLLAWKDELDDGSMSREDVYRNILQMTIENKFMQPINVGEYTPENSDLSNQMRASDGSSDVPAGTGIRGTSRVAARTTVTNQNQANEIQRIAREQGLTPQQEAAAKSDGVVNISAPPGAGKTKMLISKMLMLRFGKNVDPQKILAVTFTRDAKQEISERTTRSFNEEYDKAGIPQEQRTYPVMKTIHAMALEWIKGDKNGNGPLLHIEGLNKRGNVIYSPQVCSEEDTRDILDHILTNEIETTLLQDKSQRDPQGQVWNASSLATKIAIMKDRGVLPQQAPTKILREIYDKYQSMLKERQMIDFEDMSSKIAEHLEEHPEDRAKVQGLYSDIMVDEFQDVNLSQARLFRAITPEKNPNITMVGDPLQAIYGFRGGDNSFITPQSTRERYGNNSTFINLEDNFRSMPNIVNFALMIEDTGLKKGQARRHVVSSRGDAKNAGSPIDVFLSDAPDNATSKEAQLDYMVERMQKLNIEQQIQMTKGIGILCRTNEEVKEVKEYLQKKKLLVAKNKSESRDTDDEEPVSATTEMPGIWVSTLHASKGLEFGTVFMFNVVNGILPHSTATSSLEKPEDLEKSLDEERRLFYTGATRAKNNLIITSSQKSQSIFLKQAIKRANELGRKAMLNVHGT